MVLEAAVEAGAPEGIIGWIDVPSLEMTNLVMKEADIILATGGPGMVKAAYSSGKPALGVGAGNTPAIIDDSADIAAGCQLHHPLQDLRQRHDLRFRAVGHRAGQRLRRGQERIRKTAAATSSTPMKPKRCARPFSSTARSTPRSSVRRPHTIAELAGVDVPEDTKILIGEVESVELSRGVCPRKAVPRAGHVQGRGLCTTPSTRRSSLIADGGYGHTSSVYLNAVTEKDKLDEFAARMKTCRILVNTPSSQGGIGDLYNFKLAPSLTLGCGSWGGNSVSENVGVKHLLNIKTVAERRENMLWFRAPEKVYIKKGCLPVALDELKTVMDKKKAFIVTDSFLYQERLHQAHHRQAGRNGHQHTTFFDVAPDPTLACAKEGAEQMRAFEPDCIIALGGGSAMDAGQDHVGACTSIPKRTFMDMAMRFMDIRKRVYTFPKMGEKAYFIAIPTSAGTGSEVTPFAVITDENTGVKYPLADYELLPEHGHRRRGHA